MLGDQLISLYPLKRLIKGSSKLAHGLVISDINPKDRQNFSSCQKMCKEVVLNALDDSPDSRATIVYLTLIRTVIQAYIDKDTTPSDRLYQAWLGVFLIRLWSAWLQTEKIVNLHKVFSSNSPSSALLKKKSKQPFIVTIPAIFSLELNAHALTYLILLATEDKELSDTILSMYLFNSQSCESTFRSARSMSGPGSSIVNFSVLDFIRRTDKLAILQTIKSESEFSPSAKSLRFPRHHKLAKPSSLVSSARPISLTVSEVERIVLDAFAAACELLKPLGVTKFLQNNGCSSLTDLSKLAAQKLRQSKLTDSSKRQSQVSADNESQSDDESDSDDEANDELGNEEEGDHEEENQEEDQAPSSILRDSSTASFEGMRIYENINPDQADSYFKVVREGNSKEMYLHKQTACWLLTDKKSISSSDRLIRVQQTKWVLYV